MGVGRQSFSVTRGGATVLSGTSLKDIIGGCVCGLYNFNAYGKEILFVSVTRANIWTVGSLPAGPNAPLDAAGLASFTVGLRVSTCSPTPSLGTNPPAPTTSRAATGPTSTTPILGATPVRSSTTTAALRATPATSSAAAAPTSSSSPSSCNAGSGPGNYGGLCGFCCSYGYCPSGPRTCTSFGTPNAPPPETGVQGVPANGLDSSYAGLCSYACNRGYCPSTACRPR